MRRHPALILATAGFLWFSAPGSSLAASFQWPAAGPYVNEIAHLLFLGAMIFFIYEIRHAGLGNFRGFRYLLWAWVLLALWNLVAFVGHWAALTPAKPYVLGEGWSSCLLMDDYHAWTVFLPQVITFILMVPAFYLFYRGLKALAQLPGTKHR
jgi:hypothetical protein